MRADDRRHIDHQDIARHGLAGFLHERIQEFPGAWFRTGVEDGQSFQVAACSRKFSIRSLAWLVVRTAPAALTSPFVSSINGLMFNRLPSMVTTAGTRPLRLRFSIVSSAAETWSRLRVDSIASSAACRSQLRGFGGGEDLEAKSQREGGAVHGGDFPIEILRSLAGDVEDGRQCTRGVDGEDMVTAAREEGVVPGGEIADRGRGSCRLGSKRGSRL
jgi:hypothetical protein